MSEENSTDSKDPSPRGHNSVSEERLNEIIEGLERLDAEKEDVSDRRKALMAEAKSEGYVSDALKYTLKMRKKGPQDRQEIETVRGMYMKVLGMGAEPPLFAAMGLLSADVTSRESVIKELSKLAPKDGDIIVRIGGKAVRLWRDRDDKVHNEPYTETANKRPENDTHSEFQPPKEDVPDVDEDGAYELGRKYAQDNLPIIENPFPFGDPRRPRFDAGWRDQSGNDGMGPNEDE